MPRLHLYVYSMDCTTEKSSCEYSNCTKLGLLQRNLTSDVPYFWAALQTGCGIPPLHVQVGK